MRSFSGLIMVLLTLALASCGVDGESRGEATGTVTVTVTAAPSPAPTVTVTATPTPEEAPVEPDPLDGLFPRGFPKKVTVSSLDFRIASLYEGQRYAVAIAPGVYSALPPGASVTDAALSDAYDGFCASIDAYSRKFRQGEQFAGSCY